MKIETEYSINNLLQHKFDTKNNDQIAILEVIEVHTVTCSAGTQNFYNCRPIVINFNTFSRASKPSVNHTNGNDSTYIKYREDELIEAKQEYIDIILGKVKED